jgi:hypothetical protein
MKANYRGRRTKTCGSLYKSREVIVLLGDVFTGIYGIHHSGKSKMVGKSWFTSYHRFNRRGSRRTCCKKSSYYESCGDIAEYLLKSSVDKVLKNSTAIRDYDYDDKLVYLRIHNQNINVKIILKAKMTTAMNMFKLKNFESHK